MTIFQTMRLQMLSAYLFTSCESMVNVPRFQPRDILDETVMVKVSALGPHGIHD